MRLGGKRLKERYLKHQIYRDYLNSRETNFNKLKKLMDSDTFEMDAEWYGDGAWQFYDQLIHVEEEDWEIWADWFPDE